MHVQLILNNQIQFNEYCTEAVCAQPLSLHAPLQKKTDTIWLIATFKNSTYSADIVKVLKLCFKFIK